MHYLFSFLHKGTLCIDIISLILHSFIDLCTNYSLGYIQNHYIGLEWKNKHEAIGNQKPFIHSMISFEMLNATAKLQSKTTNMCKQMKCPHQISKSKLWCWHLLSPSPTAELCKRIVNDIRKWKANSNIFLLTLLQ